MICISNTEILSAETSRLEIQRRRFNKEHHIFFEDIFDSSLLGNIVDSIDPESFKREVHENIAIEQIPQVESHILLSSIWFVKKVHGSFRRRTLQAMALKNPHRE